MLEGASVVAPGANATTAHRRRHRAHTRRHAIEYCLLYRLSSICHPRGYLNGQVSTFPPTFIWGAATAAYQIEGAVHEGGRGESIWDRFSRIPGNVHNGDDGAVACDSYHRYPEDVRLMRELGLDAFRFSIAWPRILPEGRGTPNTAGLDFYDRLVDELLANGIQPFATLYHWDLPQALEDRGGWTSRDTVEAFTEYVEVVAKRLGDRVPAWITHNEPWVASWLGYGWGTHAPGRKSEADALAAAHHLLLSHGFAVDVLRRESPGAQVGISVDLYPVEPASSSVADAYASRHWDGFRNRWFLDPLHRGSYPADLVEHFEASLPEIADGDMRVIAAPTDFLGVNYYSRAVIGAAPNGEPRPHHDAESQYTDMGWEVYPDGLFELLLRLRDHYSPPRIYITENGAAYPDVRGHKGDVVDPERVAYIEAHVSAIHRAIAEGVPVEGYFVWSLLDNFEWARGYSRRFGLVYVDYPTLERLPKSSFYWYRDFIARANGGVRVQPHPTRTA
jgi:beta-glucosidase